MKLSLAVPAIMALSVALTACTDPVPTPTPTAIQVGGQVQLSQGAGFYRFADAEAAGKEIRIYNLDLEDNVTVRRIIATTKVDSSYKFTFPQPNETELNKLAIPMAFFAESQLDYCKSNVVVSNPQGKVVSGPAISIVGSPASGYIDLQAFTKANNTPVFLIYAFDNGTAVGQETCTLSPERTVTNKLNLNLTKGWNYLGYKEEGATISVESIAIQDLVFRPSGNPSR